MAGKIMPENSAKYGYIYDPQSGYNPDSPHFQAKNFQPRYYSRLKGEKPRKGEELAGLCACSHKSFKERSAHYTDSCTDS
jgi:hypothetical protein